MTVVQCHFGIHRNRLSSAMQVLRHVALTLWLALSVMTTVVDGAPFWRPKGQPANDGRNALRIDGLEGMAGPLIRDKFAVENLEWELNPPDLKNLGDVSRPLRNHIHKFFHGPVVLKLERTGGKHGLRAVGRTVDNKKLRAYWREKPSTTYIPAKAFEQMSYDDAVRSRLKIMEFEVQLPPLKRGEPLPSVVYNVAMEQGSMNPKAIVPRGPAVFSVKYKGQKIPAGKALVSISTGNFNGLVDPSWAKGHRPFFRPGRSVGVI